MAELEQVAGDKSSKGFEVLEKAHTIIESKATPEEKIKVLEGLANSESIPDWLKFDVLSGWAAAPGGLIEQARDIDDLKISTAALDLLDGVVSREPPNWKPWNGHGVEVRNLSMAHSLGGHYSEQVVNIIGKMDPGSQKITASILEGMEGNNWYSSVAQENSRQLKARIVIPQASK